jgi:hypothetical protein
MRVVCLLINNCWIWLWTINLSSKSNNFYKLDYEHETKFNIYLIETIVISIYLNEL